MGGRNNIYAALQPKRVKMMKRQRNARNKFKFISTFIFLMLTLLVVFALLKSIRRHDRFDTNQPLTVKDTFQLKKGFALKHLPPSESDLENLNAQLVDVEDTLIWAQKQFANRLVQVTSFGPSGLVILHKLNRLGLLNSIVTISIDTLHLFNETYEFIKTIPKTFPGINLQVCRPKDFKDRKSFDDHYGSDLWEQNPDEYSLRSKVEPLNDAFKKLKPGAWITGRRRSQGGERKNMKVVEIDKADPTRLKINPLAYWTYHEVWEYIKRHNISYNPLHDKGYLSIGDVMNTMPVGPGGDERSGRFVGLNRTECGMHTHLEKVKKMRADAVREHREFKMPTLPCEKCIDVDSKTFDEVVLHGDSSILLEFYSPMCGACQEFAPTMRRVAEIIKQKHGIQVVRFDITEQRLPKSAKKNGFSFEVTPTLFLVQRSPFRISLYKNDHHEQPLLKWITRALADNS